MCLSHRMHWRGMDVSQDWTEDYSSKVLYQVTHVVSGMTKDVGYLPMAKPAATSGLKIRQDCVRF